VSTGAILSLMAVFMARHPATARPGQALDGAYAGSGDPLIDDAPRVQAKRLMAPAPGSGDPLIDDAPRVQAKRLMAPTRDQEIR
jgi:hypothetical protein